MRYATYVISRGRPDRVETWNTLIRGRYTGDAFVVVDNEDESRDEYIRRFGRHVITYNKEWCVRNTDTILNADLRESIVYPLNAVEHIAKEQGYDVFFVIDDDITLINLMVFDERFKRSYATDNILDSVFDACSEFSYCCDVPVLSFESPVSPALREKTLDEFFMKSRNTCFQIFVRNAKFPVEWKGLIHVNKISTLLSARVGNLWLSLPDIIYGAVPMNYYSGGMRQIYDSLNDFEKCFPVMMTNPSCCYMRELVNSRAKCNVFEFDDRSYPMLVSSRYKR